MGPKRKHPSNSNDLNLIQKRAKDAERKRTARANRSLDQIEADRLRHTQQVAVSNARRTPEQVQADRERQSQQLEASNARRTPEQVQADRLRHTQQVAASNARRTPEQVQVDRERQSQQLAASNARRTPEQVQADRLRHAQQVAASYIRRTPEQVQADRLRHAQFMATTRSSAEAIQADRNRQVAQRRVRQAAIVQRTARAAATVIVDETTVPAHSCGGLTSICINCNARHFLAEKPTDGIFKKCCKNGAVKLPVIRVSELLKKLMTNDHEHSKNFMENIRSLNSCFALASMGAKSAKPPGHGPYCFRIQGQIYHRAGALHPEGAEQRSYAQLYILDPSEASEIRLGVAANSGCNPELMAELSQFMAANNPYAAAFKMMHEVEQEAIADAQRNGIPPATIQMAILQDRNTDLRRFNAPTVNEVAVVFQTGDGAPPLERDLIIHLRPTVVNSVVRKTERIHILDPNCDPMIYPLIHPYGEQSWSINIPYVPIPPSLRQNRPIAANPRKRVTQLEYYSYRFAIRDEFNPFLSAGKLTQQLKVDFYAKIEGNRIEYIKQHQNDLRAESYQGLQDFVASEDAAPGVVPGVRMILPSSFIGSPRNMQQNYQDAMAIVRRFGKPDLFITMTCNPKWEEITANLGPGQSAEFRPDLIARVFQLKLRSLLDDICKKHIFGTCVAKVHVIEFQKRGLPHAHILLILKDEDKPKTIETIDKLVSAEIPDVNTHPRLHAAVLKHMIHGPCGPGKQSPCMTSNQCVKEFPKQYQWETVANVNGYPRYKRRENGRTAEVRGSIVNNAWVVPYNPTLLLRYNCHINVEVCASIKSVKYLFKYVYKGHDCASLAVTESTAGAGVNAPRNEIHEYLNTRYVSSAEAAHRLCGFEMHNQTHTIVRLAVHLPDQQTVVFRPDQIQEALNREEQKNTTLTAWFKLNDTLRENEFRFYADTPEHFVFDKTKREWKPRQRGGEKTIGRMYSVALSKDPERFYLRLLLLHVKGATSFEDLRKVNNVQHDTFVAAAKAMGLTSDEAVWDQTMRDATISSMPRQLRDLFATICVFATPTNIVEMWEKYKPHLIEDYAHQHVGHVDPCRMCEQLAMRDIQDTFIVHGKNCDDFGLPPPPRNMAVDPSAYFHVETEKNLGLEMQALLNAEQQLAFHEVFEAMDENNTSYSNLYFLDGPGGSGKTFFYQTLLSTLRGNSTVVLPVASTGIAANLLKGGRTYHSQFGLPIPILENSVSRVKMNSNDARKIRSAKLLIWDESTMAPSLALNTVDRLLKEVMQNERPFGGKVLLLGGDFRQTLPVVRHGSRSAIVEASIKFNRFWQRFQSLKLKNNVRSEDPEFSEWLIKLGNGELPTPDELPDDTIEIPQGMIENDSIVESIFGISLTVQNIPNFSKKAILCPKNTDVDEINEKVLEILEGETTTYLSSDSILADSDGNNFPMELLNEQTPTGMPKHKLNLKIGAVIMLLRNLNTKRGLCNGTRLSVKELKLNLIIAEVLTGSAEGNTVFIPRIDLSPTDGDLPFFLVRRQFPIKLAFAMTINKSQGQTLEKVGIYLPDPVFSHGQLYVAISRVRKACDIKIKIVDGPYQGKLMPDSDKVYTKNVVYKEIFNVS